MKTFKVEWQKVYYMSGTDEISAKTLEEAKEIASKRWGEYESGMDGYPELDILDVIEEDVNEKDK